MVEKMLPLLSDGLRKIIENIREKHPGCDIAKELLLADDLVIGYNDLYSRLWDRSGVSSVMTVIREKIETLINDEARMLSFRHNAFEISYLPKGKRAIYTSTNTWGRENRQTAKPARLIQKILIREFKCKEFEDFSNWIKNEMISAGEFVLVSGSAITEYYNEDCYAELTGTLGNSCMRHYECREYFEIYEDKAKLLICKKEDKILGRAIVWELPEGTFMDRIYTCYDYLENQFIDYAQSQKWHYRRNNCLLSDGDYQEWYGPEDNYTDYREYDLTIQLDRNYTYVPYIDSFRYYNKDNNTINTSPYKGSYCLSNTDGSYGDDDYTTFVCEHCGAEIRSHNDDIPFGWHYSEYEDAYLCDDCAVYCSGLDDYVSIGTPTIEAIESNGIKLIYPESYIKEQEDYVCVEGQWYNIDNNRIKYDEETDSYILVEDE